MYSYQYKTLNNSLEQGSSYIQKRDYVNTLVSKLKLNLIQESTTPNLSSISLIEGMRNPQIDDTNNKLTTKLNDLQNEFNTKLSTYQTKYTEYLNSLQYEDPNVKAYRGKNVRNDAGAFYYVNNFGYTREYTTDAWNNRDGSCPSTIPDVTTIAGYNSLKSGDVMAKGQPCGYEGKIIRSGEKVAWVTPTGKKREFINQEILQNAQSKGGCPTEIIDVTDTQYTLIPTGNPMSNENPKCDYMGNDIALKWGELESLNNELIEIATNIYNEIGTLENSNSVVRQDTQTTKSTLMSRIKLLEHERNKFVEERTKAQSLMAKYNDLQMGMTSNYYHYLLWTLGLVTLGTIAYKKMTE